MPRIVYGLVAAAIGLVFFAGAVEAESIQETRKKTMKEMSANLKPIVAVAKGKAASTPALVDNAHTIQAISERLLGLFPANSGGEETRAKPEIWSDWSNFENKAMALREAAPGLVEATMSGDQTQIGVALGAVGKACGGCHKPYRKPKEKK